MAEHSLRSGGKPIYDADAHGRAVRMRGQTRYPNAHPACTCGALGPKGACVVDAEKWHAEHQRSAGGAAGAETDPADTPPHTDRAAEDRAPTSTGGAGEAGPEGSTDVAASPSGPAAHDDPRKLDADCALRVWQSQHGHYRCDVDHTDGNPRPCTHRECWAYDDHSAGGAEGEGETQTP